MERFNARCVNAIVVGQDDPHGGRSVRFVSLAGGLLSRDDATRAAVEPLR
jgi:hypothetical protein